MTTFIRIFLLLLPAALAISCSAGAQQSPIPGADTLRGSITPQRSWWDVTFYELHTTVNPADSSISGHNEITYRVTEAPNGRALQIDLQEPLVIDRITQDGEELAFERVSGGAWFVETRAHQEPGELRSLTVWYHGQPLVADNPPWDGGFVWSRDREGNPWVATANQGLGASAWWPNKDHLSDEPDSMGIHITVPSGMTNVSNGRLRGTTDNGDGTLTWSWFVRNPINNYNVAVNAGNYVHFRDTLHGRGGVLDLEYWVLEPNLDRAREHFAQVKPMLRCFEEWFGPYPFYEDSFKLVETPYLGMEHQSAIAYGNRYVNGYLGGDLSGSGWGLEWDFIIVHESGHEWFGNSISVRDIADLWVHEGFTHYSESIYTECRFGKEAGVDYLVGTRRSILNNRPIIAEYGVNAEGSGDMYYKGATLLHTLRTIIDNDTRWREILLGLNRTFYHQTVTSAQVESYISEQAEIDFGPVFDQYLRHAGIPLLQYYIEGGELFYRWQADVEAFDMPVEVRVDGGSEAYTRITPVTGEWQSIPLEAIGAAEAGRLQVKRDYYVRTVEVASE